ncbi:hypothetical protein HZS61_008550 [Fusarium oxysporum f. sp. conglutinans]|uniref:Uncharacterized protein n=1 Tax=Fusarium oxysporum f. sp. conglutinans TaxID=100902 RepID=A0A8H6H178_FUSOX|nr:hypothetical protein HZS61_008550 [Fusarium oxysporum f. sp. conglutinans]
MIGLEGLLHLELPGFEDGLDLLYFFFVPTDDPEAVGIPSISGHCDASPVSVSNGSSGTLDVSTVQNAGSGVADRAADEDWLDMLVGVILAAFAYV